MQLAAVSVCRADPPSQDRSEPPRTTRGTQPFELVRSLEFLQDQVVLGNADAQAKLPKLLGQIASGILTAEAKTWDDPRNLRALLVYAASGGQPRPVRAVVELGVVRGETKDLLDGILAYVEGRDASAKQILLPIEAVTLPVPLAGHIAMVQSNLVAREDPRRAMQLLERARVLAPGTLVEEAALRKEIFLADQAGDLDSFTSLASQYLRRFAHSTYAENFRHRFRAAVTRFGLTSDPARFARIATVLALLEPDEELQLLLGIAREGLVAGRVEPARRAVEKAVASASDGSAEAARATLYAATMRILTGEIDAGVGDLQTLERAGLTKPDAELAKAVLAIATTLRAEPPIRAEAIPTDALLSVRPDHHASAAAAALIQRTEAELGNVGTLLERTGL